VRLLAGIFLIALSAIAQSWQTKTETAIRTLERADGFYVVEYRYGGFATVPLTNPPGPPHYGAEITVFRVVDGKRQQIGQPFGGEYTVNGCFEDDPKVLVEYAIKHKDGPPHEPAKIESSIEQFPIVSGSTGIIAVYPEKNVWDSTCAPSQDRVKAAVDGLREKASSFERRFGNSRSASEDPITQGTSVWVIAGVMRTFADTLNDLFACVPTK
jgi:hypothetical protein